MSRDASDAWDRYAAAVYWEDEKNAPATAAAALDTITREQVPA